VIQVLQNKSQYEQAMALLKSRGLPLHITPQKNWDHQRVMELAESLDKAAPILDMGSGDGFTLAMLHELGYQNLAGVDYTVCKPNLRARLKNNRRAAGQVDDFGAERRFQQEAAAAL